VEILEMNNPLQIVIVDIHTVRKAADNFPLHPGFEPKPFIIVAVISDPFSRLE
jgi:hypothetical protein